MDETCYRVLLVEDDPADASLIRQALRSSTDLRFEVTPVDTLAAAKIELQTNHLDVVLLDLSLPDSVGLSTVETCRQHAGCQPLIVLTGHDDTEFALQALAKGAQDYLIKGRFDADDLVRAIRYAIGRDQLEKRLAETATHLQTLINALPDIVCFKDGEGRWLEANEFILKLFQLEHVDYRGRADSELAAYQDFYREAFLNCEASDEQAWQRGELSRCEESIPRPDGSVLTFDVIKIPLFYEDGRRKGLVVFGRDITDNLKTSQRQRLASRVFETTREAIMVTDTQANIMAVNPAFLRMTGFSEADVLGLHSRILSSGLQNREFYRTMWETLLGTGQWAGEVWNKRKNGEMIPVWQTISAVVNPDGSYANFISVATDLTEIKCAQDYAEQLAWRDPLTGLDNRARFIKSIEQVLHDCAGGNQFTHIVLFDIKRFKDINEAKGLAVGDALLKLVAERLSHRLQGQGEVARLSSDEFAALSTRLRDTRATAAHEALKLAENLRACLQQPFELQGEILLIDASIGITLFPESAKETAEEVLRHADMALHSAKAQSSYHLAFFETVMGEKAIQRFRMENQLQQAISSNQLQLYLQPQIDALGQQVGAESLVRWLHPEKGLIPPGVFIPLAESSDLIVGIDNWMLTEVCRLLVRLDEEGSTLRISVNISPRHFGRADFVDSIKQHLVASGADPNHLLLEVTEGLMIENVEDIISKMNQLTALGIHFSMDDFGTGYSSLAYLKRLPLQEIKIDRSFIQDVTINPSDTALVEAILAVARHLHLRVVAEGVETQVQADFLNQHQGIIHQGYLFGRPQPVKDWLQQWLES
ncbi:MAG: EAL domain-containing protein [Methylomonas lenta]|nr:EAL domain-containing protein [Methylomonas lenta]